MIELTLMIVLLFIYVFSFVLTANMLIDSEANLFFKIGIFILLIPTCVVIAPAFLACLLADKLNKL